MISSVDIPFATRLTTSATVIRIPRIQARPPIVAVSNVIRSNIRLVYQSGEWSKFKFPETINQDPTAIEAEPDSP